MMKIRYRGQLRVWLALLSGMLGIAMSMSACDETTPPPGEEPGCGDGTVGAQETCDTAIGASAAGACPTSCDDNASCTTDTLEGAGTCTAACSHSPITACAAGDGCCPAGCDPTMDSDCSMTCGDGVLDAGEDCDTGIAAGMPGSCLFDCDDGLACTADVRVNQGSCNAQCSHVDISVCLDGDGCCPAGCPSDLDCAVLSRIKQTAIVENGSEYWYRNGFWNGTAYTNWNPWSGQGLGSFVTGQGASQTYRSIDHVVLGDEKVQQSVLQMDGTKVWAHEGSWDGSAYSNWTAWHDLFADAALPLLPTGVTAVRSFDQVVFPNGKLKQTVVVFDGKMAYYRYADWDAINKQYINWTMWSNQFGDLTTLIPGQASFRAFNHVVRSDNTMKQSLLSEDGKTLWYRNGTWDATTSTYGMWSMWTNQYGDLTKLISGRGDDQTYLGWDEGALAGQGTSTGCQNGCDDSDPCTVDACVGSTCTHVAKSCNDGNLCTDDACVNGTCQNNAKNCDDGQGCTVDSCLNGECQHTMPNCDDGNPCTDDVCSNGSCQYNNNGASCGNGGTCQNGNCQASGGSGSSSSGGSSGGPCVCTTGCTDSCGQPCNEGVACADLAKCDNGQCQCWTGNFCSGVCCYSDDICGSGATKCCYGDQYTCYGNGRKCGTVPRGGGSDCGQVNCGNCASGYTCNSSHECVKI